MKKNTTKSTTIKKSKSLFSRFSLTKIIVVLTVVLFAGAFFIKQSSVQPGVYQVKTGTPATKTLNEIARLKVTNNNTNTGEPVTKLKETFGKGNEPDEGDDNPFEGSVVSGGTGTLTVVERAVKIVEDKISEYIPAKKSTGTSLSNKQTTSGEAALKSENVGVGTNTEKTTKNQVTDSTNEDSKSVSGNGLSTEKNENNSSGSPDDRQDKRDEQRALFGNIGSGYSGIDTNGDTITVKTETRSLDGGASAVVTTRTVTTPSGNGTLITKTQKFDAAGGKTDEQITTVTRTRNPDGTYTTSASTVDGMASSKLSPDKQSDSFLAPPAPPAPVVLKTGADAVGALSPDKQTEIICPDNTKLVKTKGKGSVCAPTSGSACGVYSFALNGKCYPIGSEVSPGNYVCDWTVGGRPNVKYAFLSTNCPTKSASTNVEPKNAVACSDGDNSGWWDDAAKKCYRPGELVKLDANTTIPVCKGGRLGINGTCPEYITTGSGADNMGGDKNSGTFIVPPSPTTTNGALSGDKQSPTKTNNVLTGDKPESCRFSITCSVNGSEICSNGGNPFKLGTCVPSNSAIGSDKQASQLAHQYVNTGSDTLSPDANGGLIRIVTNQNGLTDEVVSDPDDCKISGAKKNKVGAYVCPGLDGSIDSALDDTLCQFSATHPSTWGCLGEIIINSISNTAKKNDSLTSQLDNANTEINNDSIQYSNYEEGADCLDIAGTGRHGVVRSGKCEIK